MLLEAAQQEGLLDPAMPADLLERTLSFFANGVMLSWAMGVLPTSDLRPSSALGYAMVLRGAATDRGRDILTTHIEKYQAMLRRSGEPAKGRRPVSLSS